MNNDRAILALIAVRGGSKGLIHTTLRLLAVRPTDSLNVINADLLTNVIFQCSTNIGQYSFRCTQNTVHLAKNLRLQYINN